MTILACDLGGTRLKIGVVRDGKVLAQAVEPAHSQLGLAPQLPVLRDAWLRLLGGLKLTPADCAGVTVAFPSLVDNATGRILAEYGKFADAMSLDLRAWARAELGLPLAIENDARMALIGEWRAGAGQGCDNLVMMTLGTGLGTCALVEGRVLRGKHGQAGVLGGHLTVRHGGRRCSCGNLGCAEAEASTAHLRQLAETSPAWEHSALRANATLDYAQVFQQAAAGDACAAALRDHSLRVWGALAVNLIHAYDPEVLILGGGIMASAGVILPAVADHVNRHAHTPWGKVRVVPSALGDQAALVAGEWLLSEPADVPHSS
ncbi:MAG: glucokinase [Verrucomicrobiota bacterium]|nr:ROK family protein [Lacunisphaera sp.]MDQ5980063.1 glucokinase [Verrucomicrobiota bacterium]